MWLDNLPIAVFGPASTGVPALAYIQPDHLGTPRTIIDPVRDLAIWRWDLDGEAFGADAANDDPDGDGVAFAFSLRFPGQQYTPETGLNYNYQRDYDAQVGRYVQSDPIWLLGGISSYGYVEGRPLRYADPWVLASDPLAGYRPGLGPIIIKTPTTPIHWGERLAMGYLVGKATGGLSGVNRTGQIVPKTSTPLGMASVVLYFMQPIEMGCAEIDCDKNGIPDRLEVMGNSCPIPSGSDSPNQGASL